MKFFSKFVSEKAERICAESDQSRSCAKTNSDCPPTVRRGDGIPLGCADIVSVFFHEYKG